jgi:hypothetical protein
MSNIKANADLLKHITQGVAAVASATRKIGVQHRRAARWRYAIN